MSDRTHTMCEINMEKARQCLLAHQEEIKQLNDILATYHAVGSPEEVAEVVKHAVERDRALYHNGFDTMKIRVQTSVANGKLEVAVTDLRKAREIK